VWGGLGEDGYKNRGTGSGEPSIRACGGKGSSLKTKQKKKSERLRRKREGKEKKKGASVNTGVIFRGVRVRKGS